MQIYDSYKRELVSLPKKKDYSLYVCGITPYDASHIGHIATYTYFDVVVRHLELNHKANVHYVQNITDVDDSIIKYANEKQLDISDLAKSQEEKLVGAFEKMDIRMPDEMPKVTGEIEYIISKVQELNEQGFLYDLNGDWYFNTGTVESFGAVTGLVEEELVQLFNDNGGNTEVEGKLFPLDFVVWSGYRQGEPSWASALGKGRPGWHIECTSFILKHFGKTIDIHGGGADLFFPHHVCEQAQSTALGVKPVAKIWMHTALVSYQGKKMSKSSGNLIYIDGLLNDFSPAAIKIAILKNHYRNELDFERQLAQDCEELATKISQAVALAPNKMVLDLEISKSVSEALDNDLDTTLAIEIIEDVVNIFLDGYSIHSQDRDDLLHSLSVLGLVPS